MSATSTPSAPYAHTFELSLTWPYLDELTLDALSLTCKSMHNAMQRSVDSLRCVEGEEAAQIVARDWNKLNVRSKRYRHARSVRVECSTHESLERILTSWTIVPESLEVLRITLAHEAPSRVAAAGDLDGVGLSRALRAILSQRNLSEFEISNLGAMHPVALLNAFPSSFLSSANLTKLTLTNCVSLSDAVLERLSAHFGPKLTYLDLSENPGLIHPKLLRVSSLETLAMQLCPNLVSCVLPEANPKLRALDLGFPGTDARVDANKLLGACTALQDLRMTCCDFKSDELFLSDAYSLKRLYVDASPHLKSVQIRRAGALAHLDVASCVSLRAVRLERIDRLHRLDLSMLPCLNTVRVHFAYALARLDLAGCRALESVRVVDAPKLVLVDCTDTGELMTGGPDGSSNAVFTNCHADIRVVDASYGLASSLRSQGMVGASGGRRGW